MPEAPAVDPQLVARAERRLEFAAGSLVDAVNPSSNMDSQDVREASRANVLDSLNETLADLVDLDTRLSRLLDRATDAIEALGAKLSRATAMDAIIAFCRDQIAAEEPTPFAGLASLFDPEQYLPLVSALILVSAKTNKLHEAEHPEQPLD